MKITRLLSISILLSVFFSCSHGFLKDPRLYNPKRSSSQVVAPEPELQLTGGVDPFDAEAWYNNPDSNGDETNPEKDGFAAEEFNQIQITGWFSDQNVPTYTMTKGNVWKEGDASKREYVHSNAPSTEGQGFSITGVTYYQYRGINPNYDATGNYNVSLQMTAAEEPNPKLSRFYFYRFTGKGGGVADLDNYLIAIDTYSKLIFAFSEPVEFSGMGAPTKWDPTDNEAFYGQMYQFYMYDPVGYVLKNDNGTYTVQLYQWFQDSLAVGNYKANINTSYTSIAAKDKDKPGKSPFNSHDANFFEENIKLLAGQPFYSRETTEDGGNGLVLYTYVIGEDGKTITRTAKSWNNLPTETILEPRTYTISDEGENATKGTVALEDGTEVVFELTDESRTMTFGNGEMAVSNFNDPGPDWLLRVRGQTYLESGKTEKDGYSYSFSEDGKTVTFKNPNANIFQQKEGTYTFAQQDAGDRAVYKQQDAVFWGLRLDRNDQFLYSTATSWASPGITPTSTAGEWESLLKRDVEALTTFTDVVKGLEFSYRQKNDYGFDLSLMTLGFSEDGKTVSLYETIWGDGIRKETSIKDVEVLDGSSKTSGTIGGKTVTLTAPESGAWTLEYDGQIYKLHCNDLPSFVNRVKHNPVYVSDDGKTTYRFSNFGKTMRMIHTGDKLFGLIPVGNFDYVYTFVENVDTDDNKTSRAIYGSKDAAAYYAGFELSESDMLIKASRTSGAWDNTFVWDMTYDARRDRDTGGLPTEEDLNYFYESMKSKSFYSRNVENGVAGLDLLTWRFEPGRAVKHTKQTWLSGTTEDVITIPTEIQLVAVSRISGTLRLADGTRYTFTLDESAGSVLVEKTTTNGGTTSNTYYMNYNDPGPEFLLRVKDNPTFTGNSTFEFKNGGKTLIYDGIECNYDERVTNNYRSEGLSHNAAIYSFKSWGVWWFYGIELSNNDKNIRGTARSSEAVIQWDGIRYTAAR